jgi:hypothetical protein
MWRAPTTNLCCCSFGLRLPTGFGRRERLENVYEGEGDCTSETGAGQFSIFGAIEEKNCRGFSRMNTDEETA